MDRLTQRDINGILSCQAGYVDMVKCLAFYEDAEEQGRLIVLPCKVGDTVWRAFPSGNIEESRISMLQQKADGSWKIRLSDRWGVHDESIDEIGRTVFRSREEAEAALGGEPDV